MRRSDPPHALRPLIEELEPRILFSADFAPGLTDALAPQIEERLVSIDGEYLGTEQTPAQHARFEVVFIDQRVQDYSQIVADIEAQRADGRRIEIVLLDGERDGIAQIGSFLSSRQDIDALHIFSHGSDGAVDLGANRLDFDSLRSHATAIKQWGTALSEDADILIYGCDLAATPAGQSLVDALARLTGADVAASDNLTGHAALGGDYILEYSTGRIEGPVAVSQQGQQSWRHVLANPVAANDNVTTTEDTVLTVAAPGVLANDTDADTVLTPGATLNYQAANDGDGSWNNETAVTGFNWTLTNFGTDSTYTTSPGSAYTGITAAYRFSGTNSGATMASLETIAGDPTDNSASFEVWFRTDILSPTSGQHMILEVGGATNGTSLYLDNTFVKFATRTGGAVPNEVAVDLAALYAAPTSEFIQLIGVIDQSAGEIRLYVDGTLRGTTALTGTNGTDWSGPDSSGLGRVITDIATGPAAGSGTLDGDIAIVRFYEKVLTGGEAQANFWAVSGTGLTVSQVAGNPALVGNPFALASGALLTLNANGSYTYNPNGQFEYLRAGQSTTDSFTYTLTDAGGLTDSATVTITINGVNDTPTLDGTVVITLAGTNEDTPSASTTVNSLLTSASWADADAGALKGIAVTSKSGTGTWEYSTDGVTWTAFGAAASTNALLLDSAAELRYVPNGVTGETASISFKAWDQTSGAASTLSTPAYANPGAASGTTAYSANTATASMAVTSVNDAPANLATGVRLNLDGGTDAYLVDNISAVPYWQGFTGITMEFTISEMQTPAGMATLYSKQATGSASYFAVHTDGTLNWTGYTSTGKYTQLFDGGVHTLAFSWNAPAGSLRFYVDGALVESRSTTPQATTFGDGVFTLGQKQNTIGGGFVASQRFAGTFHDVRVWNHVRTATDIAQNNGYKLDLTASQAASAGLVANWQMDGFVGGKIIDTTHGYALAVGHATGTGYTASTPSDTPAVAENVANGTHVGYVVAADKDSGESHTFSLSDSAGGRFAISSGGRITVANGSLLDYETASSHAITVRVVDSGGLAYSEAVTIRVTDVNDAPTATNLNAPETYIEDTPLDLTDIVVSDVDSATVSVTLTLSNAAAGSLNTGTSGAVTSTYIQANGVWSASGAIADINTLLAALVFTPAQHFNGNFAIDVRVSDGLTAISGIKSITGTAVNDPPTTTPATLAAIAEDSGVRLITQAELLANASDVDGDSLSALGLAISAGGGGLIDNLDGTWNYTPAANDDTAVSFSYAISDGVLSTPASATLDITPVNDVPTAASTSIGVTEDIPYTGTLPAATDADGDTLTYSLAAPATGGTATVNAIGSFSYAPHANFNGADRFDYLISDGNGGSNSYTVTVDVAAVNDAPRAVDDPVSGIQDGTIAGSVLANDSDAEGDTLSVVLISGPAHGALTLNADGSFVYVPRAGFAGTDSFSYQAHDGQVASNVATVTITVHPIAAIAAPPPPAVLAPADPAPPSLADPVVSEAASVPAPAGVALTADDPGLNAIAPTVTALHPTGRLQASTPDGWIQDDLPSTRKLLTQPELHGDLLLRLLDVLQTDMQRDAGSNRISPPIRVEITPDESFQVEIVSRGAQITAASLSVGAVWWALRMSGLFASLLTSMPAWRSFDVLPVLNRKADDDASPWETPPAATASDRSPENIAP